MTEFEDLKWDDNETHYYLYKTSENNNIKYRYILGQMSDTPLICIGLNPSTATPTAPDRTYCNICQIAKNNHYKSVIMLNLYPEVNTKPNKLAEKKSKKEFDKNINLLKHIITDTDIDILCAWGANIDKRDYFNESIDKIKEFLKNDKNKENRKVLCAGLTGKGEPRHPLYLKKGVKLKKFNIKNYKL